MGRRKNYILLMVSILAFGAALGAEPNEAKPAETDVRFVISSEEVGWLSRSNKPGVGPVKPTHVAQFFRKGSYPDNWYYFGDSEGMKRLFETSAGRTISAQQREFLLISDAFVKLGFGQTVRNHRHFRLYAVSQEDARKTAEALLEIWAHQANLRMQEIKNELREGEEKIAEAKRRLPEAEAKLETIAAEYQKAKKTTRPLSSDEEAAKQAKETILEMDKILDALSIEIAGIEAKLSAVDEYKSRKNISIESLAKLEQILSEQTIELAGALAKKEAALAIREREKEFYELAREWVSLEAKVKDLTESLPKWEQWQQNREELLANPSAGLLPPKLYEDKVTIYPVRVD